MTARPSLAIGGAIALILLCGPAAAQDLSLNLGQGGGSTTARVVQLLAVLTIISLAPSIIVMVTSFTRIVVVLSFLRTALGVQQTPPNTVITSLALFLTAFIMAPVLEQVYQESFLPLLSEQISEGEALEVRVPEQWIYQPAE
jgi:flagellar biosynthetic protein FliP